MINDNTKKILFLIAPSISKQQLIETGNRAERIEFIPPYGPLSIITYVKNRTKLAFEFKILDLKLLCYEMMQAGRSEEELTNYVSKYIKDFNPDFIGISALFSICYAHIPWIENAIIQSESKSVCILGGALATGSYEEILENFPRIQIICYAEGEIPSLALFEAEEPLRAYKTNPAIVTRESLRSGIKPIPQYLEQLDTTLPFDLSYIDFEKYQGILYNEKTPKPKAAQIDIITSRGCPFNCVFCSCHLMYGKKIRFFSVEKICDELQNYFNLGIRTVRFYDENFFFDKKRAIMILEKIISFNDDTLKIEFPNGMMTARIDEEMACLLKRVGLVKANLAVESGSSYVLKHIIDKPIDNMVISRAVKALKKYGIDVVIYIVTGFPGETDIHRAETLKYIKH